MAESSLGVGRDRIYEITEEMTARAQDPRCPRPLALLIVAWVNGINNALALDSSVEGIALVVDPDAAPGVVELRNGDEVVERIEIPGRV